MTDLPRALTFATGDGRLHAAWPALVGADVGAVAATIATRDDVVDVTMPVTLSPTTTDVALEDATGGPDGSFAAVWYAVDSLGLSEVEAERSGASDHRARDRARAARRQVAIDPRSGRALVVWSQGTSALGYRPVAWIG